MARSQSMIKMEGDLQIMPTVQHFEIPAGDVNRAQGLYKNVFGWNIQKMNNPVILNRITCYLILKNDK